MSGPNMLKYDRFHSIGVNFGTPTLEKLKEDSLLQTIEFHPILARGYYDHLIEYEPESDPPILRWKLDLLKEKSLEYLRDIRTILEKVQEQQIKTY